MRDSNSTSILSKTELSELGMVWSLSFIGIITNTIQLISLYPIRHRTSTNQIIVASLSIADLTLVILRPTQFTLLKFGMLKPSISVLLVYPSGYTGLLTVFVMNVDRLLAIKKPFWHRIHINKKRTVKICLLIGWCRL